LGVVVYCCWRCTRAAIAASTVQYSDRQLSDSKIASEIAKIESEMGGTTDTNIGQYPKEMEISFRVNFVSGFCDAIIYLATFFCFFVFGLKLDSPRSSGWSPECGVGGVYLSAGMRVISHVKT
jgi:hypothetical protein